MSNETLKHTEEVKRGLRFQFGKNWQGFLQVLNEERIGEAERSLREFLNRESLEGLSFLDIGSGSGLFSLAARRLGAQVYSFDYDPQSVECTKELKKRYFSGDERWIIQSGSILDVQYVKSLGQFDVVYSWGVLHHTGEMYKAIEQAITLVKPGGKMFLALYNSLGFWSSFHKGMKRSYNVAPYPVKAIILGLYILSQVTIGLVDDIFHMKNPMSRYKNKKKSRGMSIWHDWMDWVGGYPFEVSRPDEIFKFIHARGFNLLNLRITHGVGCNEYLFEKCICID